MIYLQAAISGMLVGGLFALMAVGLTLGWGLLKVINLAHFAMILLSAYLTYELYGQETFISARRRINEANVVSSQAGGGLVLPNACSDATSGVGSCAAPVVLSGEGQGQSATGNAADNAGKVVIWDVDQ